MPLIGGSWLLLLSMLSMLYGKFLLVVLFIFTFVMFLLYWVWWKYSLSNCFFEMYPLLSNSFLAKAWFSRSILWFSCFRTEILSDLGPTELLLLPGTMKPLEDPPNYEREKLRAIIGEFLAICLILLGAGTTLDHFPLEISTSLFRSIWLLRFMLWFFSVIGINHW